MPATGPPLVTKQLLGRVAGMPLPLALDGAVALVTGGTRGAGKGIADVLSEAGATVVVCAREPSPGDERARRCDVRDADQVIALVDGIINYYGRFDICVNNAGGSPAVDAATASPRLHAKIVELNLLAPLLVAQAANAVMQAQDGGGSIVMVSS